MEGYLTRLNTKRKGMIMTDGQICKNFRGCKYPEEQIGILSQLNLCSGDVIIDILEEYGYNVKTGKQDKIVTCS